MTRFNTAMLKVRNFIKDINEHLTALDATAYSQPMAPIRRWAVSVLNVTILEVRCLLKDGIKSMAAPPPYGQAAGDDTDLSHLNVPTPYLNNGPSSISQLSTSTYPSPSPAPPPRSSLARFVDGPAAGFVSTTGENAVRLGF